MKKDLFNGNIKYQYISYIWTTIIICAVVLLGSGGFFLYFSFSDIVADRATEILLFALGLFFCLYGVFYMAGTVFIIRKYPKYKKFTKWFLNSDCYFVDSSSKEYCGNWRSKPAFYAVTSIAYQNEAFIHIKYPKKYYAYIWATVIDIILMFTNLTVAFLCLNNIEKLPLYLQSEGIVFLSFMLLEVVLMALSIVFAFRVKNVREITRKKYLEKRMIESDK